MKIHATGNYNTSNVNTNSYNNIEHKVHIKKSYTDTISFAGDKPDKISNEEFEKRKEELYQIMDGRFHRINCDCRERRLIEAKKHINKANISFAEKIFANPYFNIKHAEAIVKYTDKKTIFGTLAGSNTKTVKKLEELYEQLGASSSFSLALYAKHPEEAEKHLYPY